MVDMAISRNFGIICYYKNEITLTYENIDFTASFSSIVYSFVLIWSGQSMMRC